MKTRLISWAVALIVGAACAATEPRPKPDGMSAADHRQAAQPVCELAKQDVYVKRDQK